MNEPLLILQRQIENDLQIIAAIYQRLEQAQAIVPAETSKIVTAYYLHNLYNAFENIFANIALAFENHLNKDAGWHSQLLQRMCLDLRPIRPAVIDQQTYQALDELRRFRHLFRAAYNLELDPNRLALVILKAKELGSLYQNQLNTFLSFIQTIL